MDNRKIIITSYLVTSMVVWFLTRQSIQYFYLTFYQIRRIAGIALAREAVPVVLAAIVFAILYRNSKVNIFLDEVVSELRKVTWPTRPEVIRSTTVVIICIAFASVVLGTFDLTWGKVISYLLNS
jgi:preprotein translocase subunit SecE